MRWKVDQGLTEGFNKIRRLFVWEWAGGEGVGLGNKVFISERI